MALQAPKGAFSAYAYEVLPLMHTLLSHNQLEADQYRNDSLAFISGYRGHSNAVMRDFANKLKHGFKGSTAASESERAHSVVKVSAVFS
jgi:hypothetical protein